MTDCFVPDMDALQFFKRIENNKDPNLNIPFSGAFEITSRCNLKCVHCYVTHCQHNPENELSTDEILKIVDDLADEGCMSLLLTGGEPMLRKDFLDIYTRAKQKGITVHIFTNATLVTPEIARYFHDLPPRMVEVSVYGATKETYEKVTGVKGSYEACMKGIRLLVEQGINVNIKTMALTLNAHEVKSIEKLAKDLGLEFRFDPVVNPELDGSSLPYEYRLSPEEIIEIEKQFPERVAEWAASIENMDNRVVSIDTIYTCGAGKGRFHIDAFGKLQMCTIAREPSYDLRKGSFHDGWHNFLKELASKKLEYPTECLSCKYRLICPICPGWNILEYGSLDAQPVKYLCDLSKLRAKTFRTKEVKIT